MTEKNRTLPNIRTAHFYNVWLSKSKAAFKEPPEMFCVLKVRSKAKYWKIHHRLHYFPASFMCKTTGLFDFLPGSWELINTWLSLWRNKVCTPSIVNAVSMFPFKIHYGFLCPFLLMHHKCQLFWVHKVALMWGWK